MISWVELISEVKEGPITPAGFITESTVFDPEFLIKSQAFISARALLFGYVGIGLSTRLQSSSL